MERRLQRVQQPSRFLRCDLVLNGDVRTPAARILSAEHAVEIRRQFPSNTVETRRYDAKGDAASKIHQTLDRSAGRRFGGKPAKGGAYLAFRGRWQRVKHRQVRRQLIAMSGIVSPAKLIEPCKIARCDLSSDDQRPGHSSRGNCSSLLKASEVTFVVTVSPSTCATAQGSLLRVSPTPATPPATRRDSLSGR